jgi:hypothetical protein
VHRKGVYAMTLKTITKLCDKYNVKYNITELTSNKKILYIDTYRVYKYPGSNSINDIIASTYHIYLTDNCFDPDYNIQQYYHSIWYYSPVDWNVANLSDLIQDIINNELYRDNNASTYLYD